ncbi:MAG: winged helix-turn-helix transcriptional regulator [Pseudomonadota bacterium]
MKPRSLDPIDLEILAILQEDGRITNRNLAEQVGLSPSPCLERVRRLQDHGFIKRYTAVIDVEKLYDPVFVYAQITLGNQGRGQQAQIEDHLRAQKTISLV